MHVHLSFRSDIYNLYNLTSIELITAFREKFLSGVLLAASPVLPTPTMPLVQRIPGALFLSLWYIGIYARF